MSDTEVDDEDVKETKSFAETMDVNFSDQTVAGDPNFIRLKDFEKTLPTLEQIEAIINVEELELAVAEEQLRRQKEEEEEQERKGEETEIVKEVRIVEPTDESESDEIVEDDEAVEAAVVDDAEESEEEGEFDAGIDDEGPVAQDDMVFTGFEDEDIKDDLSKEQSVVLAASAFDPMLILDDIINMAIDKSEFKNIDAILRAKLDKKKLLEYIKQLWPEVSQEQKKGSLLQRKMVHYFRRKKYERALIEDNKQNVLDLILKYYDNLLVLDDIKAKRSSIEIEAANKIQQLEQEELEITELADNDASYLEEIFREAAANCFSQKTGQYLPEKAIQNIITKITNLRNQVSELRLALIKSQHRMAFLNEKEKRMEDLGDGLRQADFEQLHAETQGLGDKIEERNNELSKLRVRCNSNTHIISSIREKLNMLSETILGQEKTLKEQRDEVASMRNYLNSMKLERDRVRRRLKRRSFECGLLDKPILLHDYDTTTERVSELESSVQFLKDEMDNYNGLLKITLDKLK